MDVITPVDRFTLASAHGRLVSFLRGSATTGWRSFEATTTS
jgi:hypothetical protein